MDTRKRFDEIVDDVLAREGDVELTQMMGMPALKRGGKLWVGFWKGELVFKLTDKAHHAEALELDGAHLFDPGERNRPIPAEQGAPVGLLVSIMATLLVLATSLAFAVAA